jgi:hypothetical protein
LSAKGSNKMDKMIYGEFEYNGKFYPFSLINQTVVVVQYPCKYSRDFEEAKVPEESIKKSIRKLFGY